MGIEELQVGDLIKLELNLFYRLYDVPQKVIGYGAA